MQEMFAMTRNIYKKAIEEAKLKHFSKAFALYVETFLPRLCTKHSCESEFKNFYQRQFALYFNGKKNHIVALSEGDMISDLILDAYDSFLEEIMLSPFKITKSGRTNLLSAVEVFFPIPKKDEKVL